MELKEFNYLTDIKKELLYQEENLKELLKLFISINDIEKLAFLKFDTKYKQFVYKFTLNKETQIDEDISLLNSKNSKTIQNSEYIYAKLVFNKEIESNEVNSKILLKIEEAIKKSLVIENRIQSEDIPLEIFIISDEFTKEFANNLKKNLNITLNADIKIVNSINDIKNSLQIKNNKSHLIYTIKNEDLLNNDWKTLSYINDFVMVIGPNNHAISLVCGKLNIQKYLSIEEYTPELVKNILFKYKNKILNTNKDSHKVISIAGIAGGVGTTTIAMNSANLIAQKNPELNVLYIDLSTTKAVSNIFLTQNPLPEKTIIDLVNLEEDSITKFLDNGLEKITENFYMVNGIQKHIDKDLLEQSIFIEKFLNFLLKSNDSFNYIIIDTGAADASSLKSTVYDVVDEIWVVSQMNLPHISKLKTFYSLIKRAGLKDKLLFMINRFDSKNALSVNDVEAILNTSKEERLNFDLKIPNDYENLGRCWNYCELVTKSFPESIFVKKLEEILQTLGLVKDNKVLNETKKSLFSFFKKDK